MIAFLSGGLSSSTDRPAPAAFANALRRRSDVGRYSNRSNSPTAADPRPTGNRRPQQDHDLRLEQGRDRAPAPRCATPPTLAPIDAFPDQYATAAGPCAGWRVRPTSAVLVTMKTEFAEVLKPLRAQMRITLWILLPGVASAVGVGGVLIVLGYVAEGSGMSLGGLGGLVTLLHRGWTLGKDQALLELTPAIYETLFGLCRTSREYEFVLGALVADLGRLRGER